MAPISTKTTVTAKDLPANHVLRRSKYGRSRIASSILEITAASAPTQLGLYDELAAAKVLLQDSIATYEVATARIEQILLLGSGTAPESQKMLGALFSTLSQMQPRIQSCLDTVRSIAKTATDIEMSVAIAPDMLAFLAAKIERVITDTVKDDTVRQNLEHQLHTAFAETTIRSQQNEYNILSPADTVYEIDKSVPDVECNEASYSDRLGKDEESDEPLPSWTNYNELEREESEE
jgi:hypothetical protein